VNFEEAQREIESDSMAIRLNVASGFKSFLRAIQGERAVCELRKMLETKAAQENLLSRLIELSRQRIDRRYENPWDTALTIYLWLISSVDQNLSDLSAEIVAQAPQCWWAQKLSNQLLKERELQVASSFLAPNVTSQLPAVSFLAMPNTALALFSLDTVSVSSSPTMHVQIHEPMFSCSLSRAGSTVIASTSPTQINTNTAANQTLSKAA